MVDQSNTSLISRVIIMGDNGFLGSRTKAFFLTHAPHLDVIGKSYPEFDLTKMGDVQQLSKLFNQNTTIIFCSGIKKQLGDTLDIFNQNMQMVVNICHILKDHPVRRFVYFSSAEVYGEDLQNTSIDEKTPVSPTSYYGIAKFASEGLLQKVIHTNDDSSLMIIRPPLIYGIGDESRGYGPTGFCWAAAQDQEIRLWGDGSEKREFVYVEDLARIVFHLSNSDADGVVNIASGISHTYQEVLEILKKLTSHPLQINEKPRTKTKVDHGYDNRLLKGLLGDFTFTSLEKGLQQTFDLIKAREPNQA